jgi:hypothetical protein
MRWFKNNWKRVAIWGGLGLACLIVAVLAFIGARWISSGSEFRHELITLVPAEVSMLVRVDSVPARADEFRNWLDHLASLPETRQFEATSLYANKLGELTGGSLREFNEDVVQDGMTQAERQAEQFGARLFRDVLGGELLLCTDVGDAAEYMALSRVTRKVRFRWSFLDLASSFFPSGPDMPRITYSGGVLTITPREHDAVPTYITLLDDVLVVTNSRNLLSHTVQLHNSPRGGLANQESYIRAMERAQVLDPVATTATIWLNLDRMRERLPAEFTPDGREVSPVDTYSSLPMEVVRLFPDVFVPLNRIVERNLDTRPFESAVYAINLTDPGSAAFDQILVASPERIGRPEYDYLRDTWQVPPAAATQLDLLPHDTMFQATFRQPVDLLYAEVLDDTTRSSVIGDFMVAVQSQDVRAHLSNPIHELGLAILPERFSPEAKIPLMGQDFPLPGFVMLFRSPGADSQAAGALLQQYLYVQRGGLVEGEAPPTGAVTVIRAPFGGHEVYALHDPRPADNFLIDLNRTIRTGVFGEWLLLTNSQRFIEHAVEGDRNLQQAAGNIWRQVPSRGSATLYVNMQQIKEFAAAPELRRVLRNSRFNTGLVEGRDPGAVRREIAAEVGTDDLLDPEVARRFNQRREEWLRYCAVEGDKFEINFARNVSGLGFFGTTALSTEFHEDYLHVRGILRLAR